MATLPIQEHVPLAPLTTLELGGPARYFLVASEEQTLIDGLRWAADRDVPVEILGGGSNVVVPDDGYRGLVIHLQMLGRTVGKDGRVEACAGEPWDALVEETVEARLAGLECLSGIPGLVGATPIQNVGAYGQEVADTIQHVRALRRDGGEVVELDPKECEFGYRDSFFKRNPKRWVVLGVSFQLKPGGAPTLRYAELERTVGASSDLGSVRTAVLGLRARKSMVIAPNDPNRRSVGSFFLNPVVSNADANRIVQLAVDAGLVRSPEEVPRFPARAGESKLSAGWLIEQAGYSKGLRRGPIGISSNHALALVHHGGGTSAELLALADEVREGVYERFDVALHQEPRVLGDGL